MADVLDALTSRRVYKPAFALEDSMQTFESMARAGKVDAECVNALRRGMDEMHTIMARFAETDEH